MQFKDYSAILIKYFHFIFLEKKFHTMEKMKKYTKAKAKTQPKA